MMRKAKKPVSVFRQLVTSYILFAILLVVGVYVCMFGILLGLGGGNLESLAPYELVDENGNVGDISSLERNNGWIEKLDTNYNIIGVYGKKRDDTKSYTQEEVYEYLITDKIIDTHTSAKTYRGFLKTAKEGGNTYYYLIKIGRDVLSLTYNYNAGNSAAGNRMVLLFFLAFALFFFGNCFLMSRYLSRKIKKPLSEITGGMEEVIRHGVDQVRLNFRAQKEFEEIRDSFNIMTERLEAEKREKRVIEEKRNRMLLELSHDIKTPVATIKSYANALEEGVIKDENFNECYQIIDKKAVRVDVLVNEMFLLLKLDNPEYELEAERTDICELVRSICIDYYEDLESRGIEMHIDIPDEPIWGEVDKKEFTRVIENLLGNIVKYNQTGHEAWVVIQGNLEENHYTEVRIMDDGEAIEEDVRSILFDPFTRGDKARTTKGGTGLGLAIARKIVEKLSGEIGYEYGDGKNQFWIRI